MATHRLQDKDTGQLPVSEETIKRKGFGRIYEQFFNGLTEAEFKELAVYEANQELFDDLIDTFREEEPNSPFFREVD